jgi:hypothetical protein
MLTEYAPFVLSGFVPYAAYFLGILVRHRVSIAPDRPKLGDQLLLGIPMALVIVSPMLAGIDYTNRAAFLTVTGYIILHGMTLNEAATKKMQEVLQR